MFLYQASSGGLPHARGGVSFRGAWNSLSGASSPRSWGCFQKPDHPHPTPYVFPTLVGVFLYTRQFFTMTLRLPHARGGVSCYGGVAEQAQSVFPTLVGVFPAPASAAHTPGGLPHARGGVSTAAIAASLRRRSSPRSWGCFS